MAGDKLRGAIEAVRIARNIDEACNANKRQLGAIDDGLTILSRLADTPENIERIVIMLRNNLFTEDADLARAILTAIAEGD